MAGPWGAIPETPPGISNAIVQRGVSLLTRAALNRAGILSPGSAITAWAALRGVEYAAGMFGAYLALHMNGATLFRSCSEGWPLGFTVHSGLPGGCFNGQGSPGAAMSTLPAAIAGQTLGSTRYYVVRTFQGLQFGNAIYKETRAYRVQRTLVGNAHPRPFIAPTVPYVGSASGYYPPGFQPDNPRPWPVWAGPGARPAESGDGVGEDEGGAAPGIGQGGRTSVWRPGVQVRVTSRSRTAVRQVPLPRTHEAKIGAQSAAGRALFAALKFKEQYSEYWDFLETLYNALPLYIRARYGRSPPPAVLQGAVWRHREQLDYRLWSRNLVENWLEDMIIGSTYFNARGGARKLMFGGQWGSLSAFDQKALEQYRPVLEAVGWLTNQLFGYTGDQVRRGRPVHSLDTASAARARLLRRYNQDEWRREREATDPDGTVQGDARRARERSRFWRRFRGKVSARWSFLQSEARRWRY